MIALLQRVTEAWVDIDEARVAEIGAGLMVLVGVEQGDNEPKAKRLLERLLGYRIFADTDGRMNLSIAETAGCLLLVPQFTLAADTRKGRRPGFSSAADPDIGKNLFDCLVTHARQQHASVSHGRFGANMQVGLVNDGPVTFWLQV